MTQDEWREITRWVIVILREIRGCRSDLRDIDLRDIKIRLNIESRIIMNELSDLTDEVAATKAGEEAAIVALAGIEARLEAAIASGNPAALVALKDSLATERAALAAAIVAIPPAGP